MRPINVPTHTNIGTAVHEKRFGIHAASHAHIVGVLTNLYSDRLLAFLRELSTNALDSHISAKILRPIEVRLPTAQSPVFSVEDFGLGLSIEDIDSIFSEYGASTKRDDDEVNGTLGLGCKAPLAYSDTFDITARKDGIQILAVVAKDEDGVPVLRVIDQAPTNKPNGVKISVPVRSNDHHSLRSTAEDFFKYWAPGTVLVNGDQPANIRDDKDLIWLDEDVAVSTDVYESVIVQHNVAYPIERYRLGLNFGVIAFVPSGTVNFPPSREALEYTDRTLAVLETLKEYTPEAFDRVIRDRVAAAETIYERLVLVQQWRQYVPKVSQDFFGKFGLRVSIGAHGFGWRLRRGKATKVEHIGPNDLIGEFPIVTGFDRRTLTPKARAKVERFYEDTDHDGFLFLPTGTSLTAAQGRTNVVAWDAIDAAIPDAVVRTTSTARTGQTQYDVAFDGDRLSLTLKEAKDLIADGIETVVWTDGYYSDAVSRLPEALVFIIKSNQVTKIERETGAEHWTIPAARILAEATAALTDDDKVYATIASRTFKIEVLSKVANRVQDPDVRSILEIDAARRLNGKGASVTLQAYLNAGGSINTVPQVDALTEVDARYPLLGALYGYEARQNVEDLLLYVNAKWTAIQSATEAPASPTLRKDI